MAVKAFFERGSFGPRIGIEQIMPLDAPFALRGQTPKVDHVRADERIVGDRFVTIGMMLRQPSRGFVYPQNKMLGKLVREMNRAHTHAAARVEYQWPRLLMHKPLRPLERRARVRRNRLLKRAAAIFVEQREQVFVRLGLGRVNGFA